MISSTLHIFLSLLQKRVGGAPERERKSWRRFCGKDLTWKYVSLAQRVAATIPTVLSGNGVIIEGPEEIASKVWSWSSQLTEGVDVGGESESAGNGSMGDDHRFCYPSTGRSGHGSASRKNQEHVTFFF
jgi:hypothetical protein